LRLDGEKLTRRQFLAGLAAGLLTPSSLRSQSQLQTIDQGLPIPAESGIDHVVLVMMENRSFDHFLGWLPGAHGRQAGLRYPDFTGQFQPTRLALDFHCHN
jgi:phospholipase C